MEGYREDLARIHDTGYRSFVLSAAPGILELLHKSGIREGLVVDLGCGSGLWAHRLTEEGYSALGVDQSGAMIRLARKNAPRATFRRESFLETRLPDCVAVTSIGECFNYLFDEKSSERELFKLFRRVFDVLPSGGLFVFDIIEPGICGPAERSSSYRDEGDWAVLVEAEEDARTKTMERRITTFCRKGEFYRRDDETHKVRLLGGAGLATELRRIGFRVRIVRGYGDFRFRKCHAGLLCRKP